MDTSSKIHVVKLTIHVVLVKCNYSSEIFFYKPGVQEYVDIVHIYRKSGVGIGVHFHNQLTQSD